MKKGTLNFLIDGVALAAFAGMLFTGVILEFTLPARMGGGRGGSHATQLGMDRHDWGEIHFYFAIAFLLLIALHLFLHWRWIWSMARGTDPRRQTARGLAFLLITLLLLASALIPFAIPREVSASSSGRSGLSEGGRYQDELSGSEGGRMRRGRQEDPIP